MLDIRSPTYILVGMTPTKQPHHTRKTLLQAALKQFHQKGFNAGGLDDILQGTGLTKGALYHHFPNKQALGYAIVDELFVPMVNDWWLTPLKDATDPITKLSELLAQAGDMLLEEDIQFGCPMNNLTLEMSPTDEGFRRRLQHVYHMWYQGLADALEKGKQYNTVRKDVDTMNVAIFFVGALSGCRGLAKNANSRDLLKSAGLVLIDYLQTLRP